MKGLTRTANKIGLPREIFERVGYVCWVIGIIFLNLALLKNVNIQDPAYLLPVGLSMFGIGTGFISLGLANKSGRRMAAMANLEFYEKMAVIEGYIMDMCQEDPDEHNKAYANKIFYDLKGAKQLEEWVDPGIAKMLDDEIQKLRDKVLAGHKHEYLIKHLDKAKEDC